MLGFRGVDRPLWQIVMSIMILALSAQHAAAGIALYASAHEPWLIAAYAAQGTAGVLLWASLLWLRRLIYLAVVLLGASIAATAALAGFVLDRLAPSAALVQIVGAVVLSALFMVFAERVLDRP